MQGLALELSWLTNDSKATVSVLFWYELYPLATLMYILETLHRPLRLEQSFYSWTQKSAVL
jgi:hypothetical protein